VVLDDLEDHNHEVTALMTEQLTTLLALR